MTENDVKRETISLAMIVRNAAGEAAMLRRCLESVRGVFDESVIVWTGKKGEEPVPELEAVFGDFAVRTFFFEWTRDFSAARNFSFAKAAGDWICWLDADDVMVGGKRLAEMVGRAAASGADWLWLAYDYDRDERGRCTNLFWRERVVRRGRFEWVGFLHEYMVARMQSPRMDVRQKDCHVKHLYDKAQVPLKARRNLGIVLDRFRRGQETGDTAPRVVYDLGRSLAAVGKFDDALEAFGRFLRIEGVSAADCFDVLCRICDCGRKLERYELSLESAREAMRIRPREPDSYLELAETFYALENYGDCEHFLKIGMRLKKTFGTAPADPMRYRARPLLFLQDCLFRSCRFDRALRAQKAALRFYPDNEWLMDCHEKTKRVTARLALESAALEIYAKLDGDDERRRAFLRALPADFADHPFFVREKNGFFPVSGERRVVFYCGPTPHRWGPESEKDGVGGSEEAVINMARGLAWEGWKVEVFCSAISQCEDDGVKWKFIDQYDERQPCDVFVAWRRPEYALAAPDGALVILWAHDIQRIDGYSRRALERIDRIAVLSRFHRSNLPELPDEKFWITRNGINPEHFKARPGRNPLKCIYASSPDRGLDVVLDEWEEIVAAVPEAELHVFYGFTKVYNRFSAEDERRVRFRDRIMARMAGLKNVFFHGMVGHEELARHFLTAGLWLYPTYFDEVSCITAMKAQAAGAVPVCAGRAALGETVRFGTRCGPDIEAARREWTEAVIGYLTDTEQQERVRASGMQAWAAAFFDCGRLAREWSEMFRKLKEEKDV